MNPALSQPQPNPLDPITLAAMLRTTMDTLPHHPQATADDKTNLQEAASIAITALRPSDPLEAMLAASAIAAHYHLMANYRCAAQPDLPAGLHLRFEGRAIALTRLRSSTLRELRQSRATGEVPQPVQQPAMPPPAPAPDAQPAAAAARADTPPAAAQTDPPPNTAPPSRPAATAPAPRQADIVATPSVTPSPQEYDKAWIKQKLAEATPRTAIPVTGLASRQGNTRAMRPPTNAAGALDAAMQQRLLAEIAARAETSITALLASAKEAPHAT